MEAVIVVLASKGDTVVTVRALAFNPVDLTRLVAREFFVIALITAPWDANFNIVAGELVLDIAFLGVAADKIFVDCLALSVSLASRRESRQDSPAFEVITVLTAAQCVLEGRAGCHSVAVLRSSKNVTDVGGLNSHGILGGSAGGLLLLDGVLFEGDLFADNDVTLDGEVSVFSALSATLTVSLFS